MKPRPIFLLVIVAGLAFATPVLAECRMCGPDAAGINSCYDAPTGYSHCNVSGNSCQTTGPCGPACDCFLAGTMVRTPTGDRPIESIRTGELVLSSDESGQLQPSVVLETFAFLRNEYYVIDEALRTTSSQPFYAMRRANRVSLLSKDVVRGDWVTASELTVGDEVQSLNGATVIKSIKKVNRGVRVYNLDVEGDHTFFANGFLVHNKQDCPEWKADPRRRAVSMDAWGNVKRLYR